MMVKAIMIRLAFLAALMAPMVALAATDGGAPEVPTLETSDAGPSADAGAAATAPVAEDPTDKGSTGLAMDLYTKIKSGEWLPAFGLFLLLLVRILIWGLAKMWGWFDSKPGRYLVAFGSALTITVATATIAGEALSFALLAAGLSAAFVASGELEGLSDFWGWLKRKLGKNE